MRVRVYRNLAPAFRSRRMWSVMGFDSSASAEYGKVIAVVPGAVLSDVKFIVQPAGAARAMREQVKNVHAFADGTLRLAAVDPLEVLKWTNGEEVAIAYDPMNEPSFSTKEPPHRRVVGAETVIAGPAGLWARGVAYAE